MEIETIETDEVEEVIADVEPQPEPQPVNVFVETLKCVTSKCEPEAHAILTLLAHAMPSPIDERLLLPDGTPIPGASARTAYLLIKQIVGDTHPILDRLQLQLNSELMK